MKKNVCFVIPFSFMMHFLFLLTAFSADDPSVTALGATSTALTSSLKSTFLEKIKQSGPDWLGRTDFGFGFEENFKPQYSLETIQPLFQTPKTMRHTVFTQDRVAVDEDETINIGLGYRYLQPDEKWIFGINSFFDYRFNHSHERLGAGIEMIGETSSLHVNRYQAVSGRREYVDEDPNLTVSEKALSGWDVEAQIQAPYIPWTNIDFKWYVWEGDRLEDLSGFQGSIVMTLTKNVVLEMGRRLDDSRSDNFILLTVSPVSAVKNEFTLVDHWKPKQMFTNHNLETQTLVKVRRNPNLVIEKQKRGGRGIIIARGT